MSLLNTEPIVIIDDDQSICRTLKLHFEHHEFEVYTSNCAYDGIKILESLSSAIVILDIKLPDANGIDILNKIQIKKNNYYTIIITAFPDMESTVKAVQKGVGDYIYKPISVETIDGAIKKAKDFFSHRKDDHQAFIPVPTINSTGNRFIGKSKAIHEIYKMVGKVSMSRATVNITGESGTGKEMVARAIHDSSTHCNTPFVSVNCSAIVESLLESELFGHVKGSFTGAINNKEGKFALAKNGSIFLDEIGSMNINLQAKILRVLQERELDMVGGKEKIPIHCRVISATNQNLKQLVKKGKFREDLYYRLNVVNIHIPPLRDRREDIPELVLYFIAKTNKEINYNIEFISQEAISYLMSHTMKGNVRELENIISHAAIMSSDNKVTLKDFRSIIELDQLELNTDLSTTANTSQFLRTKFCPRSINDIEKEYIRHTLAYTKWHKGRACDILMISRPRLDRKIQKYGIKPI
tara:strand:- start:27917 stop:29323 length:1407 start_codon:yes stop_codon:yes gene_type:complete